MKKLTLLLFFIPFISFAQYGESRYVEIDVVDQYGNSVGTMSMMARHVDTYSNGYEVAVDRYIQYLEEKETRERAERQRNALNQRLRSLGISEVPSWDTNGIIAAAMEGYASGIERGNNSYSSSERVSESEYNEMIRSYNKKVVRYNNLNPKKTLSKKPLVNGSVSLSKWNYDVRKSNKLSKKLIKLREENTSKVTIGKFKSKSIQQNNSNSTYLIKNFVGVRPIPKYGKDYLGTLVKGDKIILLSKTPINNYYKVKIGRKIGYIPTYAISLE